MLHWYGNKNADEFSGLTARRAPMLQCAKLHALIDSCHSGTVMNLPWNAVMEGGSFTRWHEEYPGEAHEHVSAGVPCSEHGCLTRCQLASNNTLLSVLPAELWGGQCHSVQCR